MTLEQLKQEETDLKQRLHSNKIQQNKIKIQDFANKLSVHVLDNVEFLSGNQKLSGVFTRIEIRFGFVQAIVTLFKKDGSLGKMEHRVSQPSTLKKIE